MARTRQPGPFGLTPIGESDAEESADEGAVPDARSAGAGTQDQPPGVIGLNITELNVPRVASSTGTYTVSGRVHESAIGTFGETWDCRIRISSPDLGTPILEPVGSLSYCNRRTFSIPVPMTVDIGGTMLITVESQRLRNRSPRVWATDESHTFEVSSVTAGQAAINNITQLTAEWGPWLLGGSIAGYAGAQTTDIISTTQGVGGGAVVGALGNIGQQRLATVEFPTVPVLATAGLLGAGALLISEVRG